MFHNKLDDKKILIVIICDEINDVRETISIIRESITLMYKEFSFEVNIVNGRKNLAKSLNRIQKNFDAKYKIYFNSSIKYIKKDFLLNVVNEFTNNFNLGMLGLAGSEMPISGDYTEAENFYGVYNYCDEDGNIQSSRGKIPFINQSVQILESSFFATSTDIDWDEQVGDDFLFAAQCMKYRRAGFDVKVIYQPDLFVVFDGDFFSYNKKINKNQLEKFQKLYKNEIAPLVSILIPTYNQPKYFFMALESALAQTYPNIEILVGDDSTNEDTKNLIQPYLKKYKNLKYFFHDGKIPRGGGANTYFLLNTCRGEFINFLFHDDLFYPEKIFKMMKYYVRDLEGQIALVTSIRDSINSDTELVRIQSDFRSEEDVILSGEKVGREMLFTCSNFIGEMTTVLIKKNYLRYEDAKGKKSFFTGGYAGVFDTAFGDIPTFLNILKDGGDLVFISESLSAFRTHSEQNTYNPNTRIHLISDMIIFITLSWIRNFFLHNVEEYKFCCRQWLSYFDYVYSTLPENLSEKNKLLRTQLLKLKSIVESGDCEKILDASISYLLNRLPKKNSVLNFVKKNFETGRWEKVDNGIMFCVSQNDD